MKAARHLLALGVVASAAVFAGPPPSQQAPPPPDAAPPNTAPGIATPGVATPDGDFIEFLGADDVGDAALWAFLKKSAQRKDSTRTPPPQDAKQ